MSRYEFILCLVAILSAAWVFKELLISRGSQRMRYRGKRRHGRNAEAELQAENNVAAENLKAMEERIKVLEKIITDRDADLRDQFRDLENRPDP